MLHKRASRERGVSIAELLTVTVIAGLVGTIVVALTRPIVSASNSELASLQEIQLMDTTLYRIQREIRQSDPNGIFVCTNAGGMSCSLASNLTTPTSVTYLAILTARSNGTGEITWDSSGRAVWTGFNVYWLVPDAQGTNTLLYGFGPASVSDGDNPSILNSDVANAVSQAVAGPGTTVAQNVRQLQTMVDVTSDHVTLVLVGLTSRGNATSELSVQGDVYARN